MIDMPTMRAELTRDEDDVPYAYQDSLGYWTIAVGHCIDHRLNCSLPDHIRQAILEWDIGVVTNELDTNFPWWQNLDPVRQRVMVNMCFNLGIERFSGFQKFLAAMQAGDWQTAAAEMQDSQWWGQVGERAVRLQQMVLTGEAA